MGMRMKARMGELFWDWGIPTAAALAMVRKSVKVPVVASGGIRNGMEVAKAIAMGANMCATAWPLLKRATISSDRVKEKLEEMTYGLKTVMFVTGCKNIKELGRLRYATTGELDTLVSKMQ